MEFHEKLRLHLKRDRFSQSTLAEALDVSQNLVSRWSRGKNVPDVHQARAIADFLGLSLDYLTDVTVPALSREGIDLDREIRRLLRTFGPEESWRKLVEAPKSVPAIGPPTEEEADRLTRQIEVEEISPPPSGSRPVPPPGKVARKGKGKSAG
jgi:transcriptional regulator with XRE-family HTH domain